MVYVEEKVRKQHAFNVNDGKDKYLHHTKAKGRKFFYFFFLIKQLAKQVNSVSRMIN